MALWYSNDIYSAFAFLGFVLSVIPLYWHLEAWNVGTVAYMMWTAIGCLNKFINSIVWKGNAINWAPVWCDISSRLIIAVSIGTPAAALCITRRLYHITRCEAVMQTRKERRRQIIEDLLIAFGLPILDMIIYIIPQGHRFNILEDVGCEPEMFNTVVSLMLVSVWPVAIGLVSAIYCFLALRAFVRRSSSLASLRSSMGTHANLDTSRYWRLMALASVDFFCTVPLNAWQVAVDCTIQPVYKWKSWADTHSDFGRVVQVPRVIWEISPIGSASIELERWSPIICAVVFFAFFGFAAEAQKHYKLAISSVSRKIGISTGTASSSTASSSAMQHSSPGFGKTNMANMSVPSFVDRTYGLDTKPSVSSFNSAVQPPPGLPRLSITIPDAFHDEKDFDSASLPPSALSFPLSSASASFSEFSPSPISPPLSSQRASYHGSASDIEQGPIARPQTALDISPTELHRYTADMA